MRPQVALRKIAAAARYFANLRDATGCDFKPCAYCITIALCTDQLEGNEMVSVSARVVKKKWRIAVVGYQHIHKSVVVEIRESHAPPNVRSVEAAAGRFRDIRESAVAVIMKKRI